MVRGERHVDKRRLADGLAVVERFDGGELTGAFVDLVGNLEQKGRAFLDGLRGPGRLGRAGSADGALDIGGRGVGAGGKLLARGGIERIERAAAFGIDPFAVDEKTVAVLNVLSHGSAPNLFAVNCVAAAGNALKAFRAAALVLKKRLGAAGLEWNQPDGGEKAFLGLVLRTDDKTRPPENGSIFDRDPLCERGKQIITCFSRSSYRLHSGGAWSARSRDRRESVRRWSFNQSAGACSGLRMKSVWETPSSGNSASIKKPARAKIRRSSAPLKNLLLPLASTVK